MNYSYLKSFLLFLLVIITVCVESAAQQVLLTSPVNNSQYTLPAPVPMEAIAEGFSLPEPAQLRIINSSTGYRKLKIGYSPSSLYSPLQNVISGGNTHMEITMKVMEGLVDWNKIMVKPMGIGSLSLQPYISAAGGLGQEFKTISIPLSDFSSAINFTQIANIELPYSANAAPFVMAISMVRFTGGATPFLWFGDEKTDNKHNGNGGAGELVASVSQAQYPQVYPVKVEFYNGPTKIGEDVTLPYQFEWINPPVGDHALQARLILSDNQVWQSDEVTTTIVQAAGPGFSVAITAPSNGDTLQAPGNTTLAATVDGLSPMDPDQMKVINNQTGFRKLKFGYSPTSLYSPLQNVIAGGNTHMEITLRDITGGADWSRIQLRPAGLGSLSLLPYVNAAGGIGNTWQTIVIPLSDFVSTINFSAIANLEFPYSASAAPFEISIRSIRFIGGTSPFVWFGFGKTNNLHNGNGGAGELIAAMIPGWTSGDYIEKVEFFSGEMKLGEDTVMPYTQDVTGLTQGVYNFTARVVSHNGGQAVSPSVGITVFAPPAPPSVMSVEINSPSSGSVWLNPAVIRVKTTIEGAIIPGPDYMKVDNSITGYVKMKLGYSPTSIYSPKQNVIAGGNHTLEITLKNCGGPVNWSQIRIRPVGVGLVNVGTYAGTNGIGNEWTTIRIPLSDFDPAIDFSAISFMEFPYSANAGNFSICIQKIAFTGGFAPFVWFGDGKTNNAHDGDGTAGHMSATIMQPGNLAVDAEKLQLFSGGILVAEDSLSPFDLSVQYAQPGTRQVYVKMTDTRGGIAWSDTINVEVVNEVPEGFSMLTVDFNEAPGNIEVSKSALKYDKDFAYSFSLDDGLSDAWSCAFPLLNGGFSPVTGETYPGMFYTDGCGNDIPFRGSLMWNSVNSSFQDIHINTPSYVTWTQLNEMLDEGWSVVNHSYSHATGTGVNHAWQIQANDSAVFSHTGRHMSHFVTPSGDPGYFPAAWNEGIICSYNRTASQGNPDGLAVDGSLNYNQFSVYRDFKCDDLHNSSNVMQGLDNCAAKSTNGRHFWYNDFTHHVTPWSMGGSLLFETFRQYMTHAVQKYGKNGSDRMWMASGVEVFDYLRTRDASSVTWSLTGNQLRILVDRGNVPDDLSKGALSLVFDSEAEITEVNSNDGSVISFRGNTNQKLINLEWAQPWQALPGQGDAGSGNSGTNDLDENAGISQVSGEQALLIPMTGEQESGRIEIFNTRGKIVFSREIAMQATDGRVKTSVPSLPPGVYIVRMTGEKGRVLSGRYCQPQ